MLLCGVQLVDKLIWSVQHGFTPLSSALAMTTRKVESAGSESTYMWPLQHDISQGNQPSYLEAQESQKKCSKFENVTFITFHWFSASLR